jgi:hypothetical protein
MDGGAPTEPDAGPPPEPDAGPPTEPDAGPPPEPDAGPPDAGPPPPACGDETRADPADPTAGSWATEYSFPGLGGDVGADGVALAVGADGATVYVGGLFSHAGSTPAANVASWNPASGWAPLGDGIEGRVDALAADPRGTVVWAAAEMYETSDTELLRWDGSSWTRMTTLGGLGRVDDLKVDAEGRLYVAGLFEGVGGQTDLRHLAVYDGSTWSSLGGNPDLGVSHVLLDGTEVCVGGRFQSIGEVPARNVACWDGSSWTAYDLPHEAYEVRVLVRDADGALLAGGRFSLDPTDASTGGSLARWTGSGWEYIGDGVHSLEGSPGLVEGIAVVGTDIYVGGYFNAVGPTLDELMYRDVARWDGTRWHDLGGAARHMGIGIINQNVRSVVADDAGNVFIAGMFSSVGTINAGRVAMWDGSYWSNLSSASDPSAGINGTVRAFAARGDCGVYVGGDFVNAGDVVANNVVRVDASGYHPLGDGLDGNVTSLAIDSEGRLYAGGLFTGPGFYHLARWDGAEWSGLGNTMGQVTALAIDDDDNLYVSGVFSVAGDAAAENIAMYDGTAWHALGAGLDGPAHAMTFDDSGALVVAGRFQTAGGVPAVNVARWDGSAWSAYGDGLPGPDRMGSVAFFDGRLVVGGGFGGLGEDGGKGVAVWDGSRWAALGGGLHTQWPWGAPYLGALVPVGDLLFAFGEFSMASGEPSVRAAYWDGTAWHPMGGGFDYLVEDAIRTDDSLWVGGAFAMADGIPSVGIARWRFAE